MNCFLKSILGLFTASLFLISCSDDDSSEDNNISFDGTEYDLSQGFVLHYDDDIYDVDTLCFYELSLFSSDFEITYDEDDYPDEITGEGQAIFFEINSSTSDDIALGTYTYFNYDSYTDYNSDTSSDKATYSYSDMAGTFSYSLAYSYANTETQEFDYSEIEDGTLTISKNGDSYTLSFDLTGEDGVNVTGYYSGSLEYIDEAAYTEATSIKSAKKSFSMFQN